MEITSQEKYLEKHSGCVWWCECMATCVLCLITVSALCFMIVSALCLITVSALCFIIVSALCLITVSALCLTLLMFHNFRLHLQGSCDISMNCKDCSDVIVTLLSKISRESLDTQNSKNPFLNEQRNWFYHKLIKKQTIHCDHSTYSSSSQL